MKEKTFEQQTAAFEKRVNYGVSYDVFRRRFLAGGRRCALYMIDGSTDQDEIALLLSRLMACPAGENGKMAEAREIVDSFMPFGEIKPLPDGEQAVKTFLSGVPVLLMEGCGPLMVDARNIPQRRTTEPDKERTLRGSHDGFVEILSVNSSLLRRRIHSEDLVIEDLKAGRTFESDVLLCYMRGRADGSYLEKLRERIRSALSEGLVMNQESLSEYLVPQKFWNPFPRIRQTERPDMAAAAILEGHVVVMADNASTVMILPARLADFLKEANDYYFPPFVGTYYRWIRLLMMLTAVSLTPLVLLLNQIRDALSPAWEFLLVNEKAEIPLYFQFLVYEALTGMLRMSALNTPHNVGNVISIVVGAVVGEFAVSAGWASAEVVYLMSFVSVTVYAQQNLELGYALKFIRLLWLTATALLGRAGFFLVPPVILFLLALMRTDDGKPYLAPLLPFRPGELSPLFKRSRIKR